MPTEVGLDWFYLPLYPLTNIWGNGAVWAFLGAFSLMIALMPWLPPLRRAKAGADRSGALQWLRAMCRGLPLRGHSYGASHRRPPFPTQAEVNPSLCVSCGICVGACPSSTPFRRCEDLKTGIDLPDYSLKELRERVIAAAGTLTKPGRVLVLACEHGAAGGRLDGTVVMPCVAMMPPSLIDFVLSRDLADGVVGRGLRGKRLLQPPRYPMDGAALCRASAIPICARGFRATGLPRSGLPRSR